MQFLLRNPVPILYVIMVKIEQLVKCALGSVQFLLRNSVPNCLSLWLRLSRLIQCVVFAQESWPNIVCHVG